jgi:hypothetical protein
VSETKAWPNSHKSAITGNVSGQRGQIYHCEEVFNGHAAKEGIPKGRRWKLESSSVACIRYTNSAFLLFRPEPQDAEKKIHQKFTSDQLLKKPKKLEILRIHPKSI